jgi:hypothetical protein
LSFFFRARGLVNRFRTFELGARSVERHHEDDYYESRYPNRRHQIRVQVIIVSFASWLCVGCGPCCRASERGRASWRVPGKRDPPHLERVHVMDCVPATHKVHPHQPIRNIVHIRRALKNPRPTNSRNSVHKVFLVKFEPIVAHLQLDGGDRGAIGARPRVAVRFGGCDSTSSRNYLRIDLPYNPRVVRRRYVGKRGACIEEDLLTFQCVRIG